MKTIMHPDYWVEIPAGKFLVGLPDEQYNLVKQQIEQNVKTAFHKELLAKVNRHRYEVSIDLQRFYIARFPVVSRQSMIDDTPITNLLGILDMPPDRREVAAIQSEDALFLFR